MAITGRGSGIAWAQQTDYDTAVAVSKRLPFISENIQVDPNYAESAAIHAGGHMMADADLQKTHEVVAGPVTFPLYDRGLEEWFDAVYGGYSHAATTHTFWSSGDILPSLSVDVSLGSDTNTPEKALTGTVLDGYSMSATTEDDSPLQTEFRTMSRSAAFADGQNLGGTLVDPAAPFVWTNVTVDFDGNSRCVQEVTLEVSNNLSPTYCLGQTFSDAPLRPQFTCIGTLVFQFSSVAEMSDMQAGTSVPLVITATSGSNTAVWTQNVKIVGGTPAVEGEDIITLTQGWRALAATAGSDATGHQLEITNDVPALP